MPFQPSLRTLVRTIVALIVAAAIAGPASAHQAVSRTVPRTGAVVKHLPRTVSVTFRAPVIRVVSIRVLDRNGVNHAGKPRRNPSNAMQAMVPTSGDRLGRYTVVWRIVGVDGHTEQGTFRFTVRR